MTRLRLLLIGLATGAVFWLVQPGVALGCEQCIPGNAQCEWTNCHTTSDGNVHCGYDCGDQNCWQRHDPNGRVYQICLPSAG